MFFVGDPDICCLRHLVSLWCHVLCFCTSRSGFSVITELRSRSVDIAFASGKVFLWLSYKRAQNLLAACASTSRLAGNRNRIHKTSIHCVILPEILEDINLPCREGECPSSQCSFYHLVRPLLPDRETLHISTALVMEMYTSAAVSPSTSS